MQNKRLDLGEKPMMKAQIKTARHVEPRRTEDTVLSITGAVKDAAAVLSSGNTTTTPANFQRFGVFTLAVLVGGR